MTPTIREQKSRRSAFTSFFFSCSRDRGDCACLLWGGIGQIKSVGGTITSCLDGNNARQGLVLAAVDQRIRISFEFLLDRRLVLELKYLPVG